MPDNPKAFARTASDRNRPQTGMTLRDYFAGQALAGLLAHASGEDPHNAPGLAYKLADDMLKERKENG